ncbi:hypothetical protein NL676_028165 [Syzygium grande]|nr:hypothetical protein NL676_028165 [Syzygium grande]
MDGDGDASWDLAARFTGRGTWDGFAKRKGGQPGSSSPRARSNRARFERLGRNSAASVGVLSTEQGSVTTVS